MSPEECQSPRSFPSTGAARHGASWLLDGDRLVVMGGLSADGTIAPDVRVLSLADGRLAGEWPLCLPRYLFGDAPRAPGERLLVGGLVPAGSGLAATCAVELVDVRAGTSTRLPDVPFPTAEPLVMALHDGSLLVAGGYDDAVEARAAVLDADSAIWRPAPPLPGPRAAAAGPFAAGERHVLFIGGTPDFEGPALRDGVAFDLHTREWQSVDIDVPPEAAVTRVPEGLLVSGGRDAAGDPVACNTLWTWSRTG